MKTLKIKSPGKLNLRLDVLGKRSDGYHNIRMLNSMVSLYDDIELKVIDRGIEVYCENDPAVPSGEDNIVYKACKEIMAYSNKNVGMEIRIKKNVPSSSGMGGGSSNAASVILGINQLLKINLSQDKLMKIGLRFGSDIPFFLYGSPAIAEGIGEDLSRVKKMPRMPFVIVTPKISVPTKSIYDRYPSNGKSKTDNVEIPREFTTKKAVIKFLNNDLEQVTVKQFPVIDKIKELLLKHGALGAQMTGSGPTVFGIFSDKVQAERASKKIASKGEGEWNVFVAENV